MRKCDQSNRLGGNDERMMNQRETIEEVEEVEEEEEEEEEEEIMICREAQSIGWPFGSQQFLNPNVFNRLRDMTMAKKCP